MKQGPFIFTLVKSIQLTAAWISFSYPISSKVVLVNPFVQDSCVSFTLGTSTASCEQLTGFHQVPFCWMKLAPGPSGPGVSAKRWF